MAAAEGLVGVSQVLEAACQVDGLRTDQKDVCAVNFALEFSKTALEAVDLGCLLREGLAGLVQRLEFPLGVAEVIAGAGEVGGAGTVSTDLGNEVIEALDGVSGGNVAAGGVSQGGDGVADLAGGEAPRETSNISPWEMKAQLWKTARLIPRWRRAKGRLPWRPRPN